MNSIVPPIATMSSRSSETSCSTSTRSTITWVKTGSTICSTLMTSASPSALAMSGMCGRTIGQSQARPRGRSRRLLEGGRVVEERRVPGPSALELLPWQRAGSPTRDRPRRLFSPSGDGAPASDRRPNGRWPGSGMRSRLDSEALTDRAASPSSSAALQSERRLVPSSPVFTSCRMRASDSVRPKCVATMASAAAPQSISSTWRMKRIRRSRRLRLTKRPSNSNGCSSASSAVAA